MVRSIKTAEHERPFREEARRVAASDLSVRLAELAARLRTDCDMRPISREEWNAVVGDQA